MYLWHGAHAVCLHGMCTSVWCVCVFGMVCVSVMWLCVVCVFVFVWCVSVIWPDVMCVWYVCVYACVCAHVCVMSLAL